MRQATLSDLVAADDSQNSECPPGFDYQGSMARVGALRAPLQALVGLPFELDTSVQDASFFTDLYSHDPIPRIHPKIGRVIETIIAVRFSSFGRFFSVWGSSSVHPFTDELRTRVAEFVSAQGFVYVPSDLLDKPHPVYGTWQIRFFDYL